MRGAEARAEPLRYAWGPAVACSGIQQFGAGPGCCGGTWPDATRYEKCCKSPGVFTAATAGRAPVKRRKSRHVLFVFVIYGVMPLTRMQRVRTQVARPVVQGGQGGSFLLGQAREAAAACSAAAWGSAPLALCTSICRLSSFSFSGCMFAVNSATRWPWR